MELLVENETQLVLRCYYGGLLGTLLFDCYNGNIPLPFLPEGRSRQSNASKEGQRKREKIPDDSGPAGAEVTVVEYRLGCHEKNYHIIFSIHNI